MPSSRKKKGKVTVREFLQYFGTEIVRKIKDDAWVSSTLKIINEENWGLRDLSYSINKFKKAFYNYFQIEASGNIIKDLNQELNQSENLLRYLFIKVKEHQELPTKLNNEKK